MEWKPIVGYENYEISEYGDIRNLNTGKIRKKRINSLHGYVEVDLYKNGQCSWKRVHRLVAEAFLDNPNSLPVVMHKDNDKTNNHYTNLEWGTVSENTKQAFDDGLEDTSCLYELYNDDIIIRIIGQDKLLSMIKYGKSQASNYANTNMPLKRGPYKHYKIKRIGRAKRKFEIK